VVEVDVREQQVLDVPELVPALRGARELTSAYVFYDCQTDDVRLVLTVLGEAERFGAVCANRCEVTDLVEENGRAAGVRVRDLLGGSELAIRADSVVNATGVWADRIRPEELRAEAEVPDIRPSRGTHVTVAHDAVPLDAAGAIVPAAGGRNLFALPWLGRTLIGTTDRDYEGPVDRIPPDEEDIAYLLEATNEFFSTSLGPSDLTGAYAGVRPLISIRDTKKSVDISRKAELFETSSGLVTITGGKLTTWRRMAKLAVDRIADRQGRGGPRCRTHEIPLGQPVRAEDLPAGKGIDEESRALLASRYGHRAREVLALAEADPRLARRIVPDLPDVLAEAAFAARHEQAQTVGDVLLRRTRLGVLDARTLCGAGAEAPRAVAEVLASELGWEDGRAAREAEAWRTEAEAEGIAAGTPG